MPSRHIKNLQIGFGLSLFLLLASSIGSFISIREMINSSGWVSHTRMVLQKLEEVISFTKDAETGQRGFLLTHDVTYLAPYNGSREKVVNTLEELKKLTGNNKEQQQHLQYLKEKILQRFYFLKVSIDSVQAGKSIDPGNLKTGQILMTEAREQANKMSEIEEALLIMRTARANQFAKSTPVLIIVAAVMAILITFYFYKRVGNNFKEISKLNEELSKKDKQIASRITAIEKIAGRISQGDYATRVTDEEKDDLGSLAGSLNKMAQSLDHSFNVLAGKEWLQKGTAELNESMAGEKSIHALANDVISFLAKYSESDIGAFYHAENEKTLRLQGGYALVQPYGSTITIGQGVVGQCAIEGKPIALEGIDDKDFVISFSAGEIKPRSVYAFPVFFEGRLLAVIELGSRTPFATLHKEFFGRVAESIGIAFNTVHNRIKLQELLEETQSQSEELQAQHSELESLNTELEAQAHKLQASEEELKVQQEELMETNQELEERSRLLEEKNHLIVVRNLDIQKKAEELAMNAKYKSEFLANMSHELRTPLNSILLLSRLLAENNEKNLKEEQVEYARVIQSSGNGLLQLIDEILDLSRIESGKMQLDFEEIALQDIGDNIKSLFGPMAKEKGVTLNVEIDSALPLKIETDKLRLEQILRNLVSNALKFTNKGFINVSIRADQKDQRRVEFSVKDSGIGIPTDKQELIFEAFQQADGSTQRKYGGTGLGLSISRQLALLLGGSISLSSEAGVGSEFIVTLPLNRDLVTSPKIDKENVSDPVVENKPELVNGNGSYTSTVIPEEVPDDRKEIKPGDKTILIIEDDTTFAKSLLEFTRKKGYKGLVAVRGDEGIEMAKLYKPMGILLDIQLPVKSGWQVMDEIKKDSQTRHIPVHIVSSFEMKKESLTKGAVDFVYKPLAFEKMDDVFRKIESVVKKDSRKVLIVEDNPKHARALAYFLSTYNINSTISGNINDSVESLDKKEIDCVILDMGIPDMNAYKTLDTVKKNAGMEDIPVLIFTGKSLSRTDEIRIKQYADSIVMKTAHSYQRILDEVSLFLHLVEENNKPFKKPTSSGKGTGSLSEVLHNKKILVADDDVRNIFSVTKILEKHKMQVVSAIDGKEAIAALEKNPDTNIVLMDIMMPEMDGFEAIAAIRKQSKWRNLPVIAVTAKAMTGDREKCIKAGASDYISKPVDIDQLLSLLRIWLYEAETSK
jgi:signal transduction histidine kinase/CheY-like chemotaxis protein/CHASE3 domain sensor protein